MVKDWEGDRLARQWAGSWLFSIGMALMTYGVVLQQRLTYAQARQGIVALMRRLDERNRQPTEDDLRRLFQAKLRGEE